MGGDPREQDDTASDPVRIRGGSAVASARGSQGSFRHRLLCLGNGSELDDDGLILHDPRDGTNSLLRSVYLRTRFAPDDSLPGIYRYSDWLPVSRVLHGSATPVTYLSTRLGKLLGLRRLYVTFNGRWDRIGALMPTGTFKDCEAYSVLARLPAERGPTLVVASAGNTARAFIEAASANRLPLVAVFPGSALEGLWLHRDKSPNVLLVAVSGGADYLDAIRVAELICRLPGFHGEGGARNVARRDGLGVSVLGAAEKIGEIPDYYFQAVGSGTGAIAAHEANLRLNASGLFAPKVMRLVVSQNSPFTPIVEAWNSGSRSLAAGDEAGLRSRIDAIDAKTLSNRNPPYGLRGGLYDALADSRGEAVAVSNAEARAARALFQETEGCDISAEAGVAAASLMKKAGAGELGRDALVMLNVTGGGYERLRNDPGALKPGADLEIGKDEFDPDRFLEAISHLS